MKKVFAFVLASVMMLTLVACGNTDNRKADGVFGRAGDQYSI